MPIFDKPISIKTQTIQLLKLKFFSFILITVYNTPHSNFTNLKNTIDNVLDKQQPTIISGDFNFHFSLENTNLFTNYMLINGFKQLVHSPTHVKGNCLDHIYSNLPNTIPQTISFHSPYYSDHNTICLILNTHIPPQN